MKNIKIVAPRTLSGFMELAPRKQVQFDAIQAVMRDTFLLYGFTPLDTPLLESSEVLLAKGGGETDKQMYRFVRGEHDLALRFDLTVPLAKYVAANCERLAFPFRRFQFGKVYRGERAQRGRFREFYQADIDVVGDGDLGAINEAEIPGVIYKCFTALGLNRFVIRINNRKALSGLLEVFGLSKRAAEIMRALDKLEKIGADKTRELLTDALGVPAAAADELLSLLTRRGDALAALSVYSGKSATLDRGVSELGEVARYLGAFGVPETHFEIDLSVARGLDYYTGAVYETRLLDHPEIGSICSGGRYDDLASHFTDKKRLPGVGVSIGLTRLFYVLNEQGYLNKEMLTAPADVLIIPMTDDLSGAVSLATTAREAGIRVMIYGEDRKFKAKLAYADKLGIPFTVFLGEDEISSGKITVKDMATGEQTTASPAILCEGIREKLHSLRAVAPVSEKTGI
ncbi:MAG: histidine--tRNA ligase [Oscillospiraceae bacterium]|jgi:histidyl-tRNA synthetase|nr:histidine--tRNA ligase [Oscillospiraceae bacterium]